MKLENFEEVRGLIKRREYLTMLKASVNLGSRIKIGQHDVYPELAEKLRPELTMMIDQQIAVVDEQMTKLGVEVESAPDTHTYIQEPGGSGAPGAKPWSGSSNLPG